MKYMSSCLIALALSLVATGCKKKTASSQSSASTSTKPVGETKNLPKLGIKIQVPSGATFLNESDHGVDVNFDEAGVQIMKVEGTEPVTFGDAVARAERGELCPFGSWIKKDQTPTGWHLEWTCKVGPTASKTLTNVEVRTIIDGKHFDCGNQVSSAADVAAVAQTCASVKKL